MSPRFWQLQTPLTAQAGRPGVKRKAAHFAVRSPAFPAWAINVHMGAMTGLAASVAGAMDPSRDHGFYLRRRVLQIGSDLRTRGDQQTRNPRIIRTGSPAVHRLRPGRRIRLERVRTPSPSGRKLSAAGNLGNSSLALLRRGRLCAFLSRRPSARREAGRLGARPSRRCQHTDAEFCVR